VVQLYDQDIWQRMNMPAPGYKRPPGTNRGESAIDPMYGPAAIRKRDYFWLSEVADMYPACLIGSRAVALLGVRTLLLSH
jgi:hypothetical protein